MRGRLRGLAVIVGVLVAVFGVGTLVLVLLGQLTIGGEEGPSGNAAAADSIDVPRGAQRGTVTRIVDGDTLHLTPTSKGALDRRSDVTVRLLEIDTPESKDARGPHQCYSDEATAELSRLVPEGSVVRFAADRELLDQYGRTLLYVWNDDGTFVNLAMVRRGFAKAVLFEPNDQHIATMRAAQRKAEAAGRGLWGACDYFGAPDR